MQLLYCADFCMPNYPCKYSAFDFWIYCVTAWIWQKKQKHPWHKMFWGKSKEHEELQAWRTRFIDKLTSNRQLQCTVWRVSSAAVLTASRRLVGIQGRQDGTKYRQILKENLIPRARDIRLRQQCSKGATNTELKPTQNWKALRCRMWKSLTGPANRQRWKPRKKICGMPWR